MTPLIIYGAASAISDMMRQFTIWYVSCRDDEETKQVVRDLRLSHTVWSGRIFPGAFIASFIFVQVATILIRFNLLSFEFFHSVTLIKIGLIIAVLGQAFLIFACLMA